MTSIPQRPGVWLGAYLVLVLLPVAVSTVAGTPGALRAPRVEASSAAGLLAYALLTLQVALVARIGALSRSLGSDALMQLHRSCAFVALALALAHPLLLVPVPVRWASWNPFDGIAYLRAGAIAFWVIVVIIVTTVARAWLRVRYETWHALHLAGAVAMLLAATYHLLGSRGYAAHGAVRAVVLVYAAGALLTVFHYRVVRPWQLTRHPWRLEANDDIGGSTRRLRLRPAGHAGLRFAPGQFVWVSTGRSPLFSQQHPLSIASSAATSAQDGFELAIKDLGDWSGGVVPTLAAGHRVWVDGPFGAFTLDRYPDAQGFVLIAGGIGIAPMRAMLLTMRDRRDQRPVVLFYATSDPSRDVFGPELAALSIGLALRVVRVYEHSHDGWDGERGLVTGAMLARHVPALATWHTFACGPLPMMSAIERELRRLSVPSSHVHTERFQVV